MTLRTTYERLPVTTLASGHDLFIPLHRLEGASSGPTLGLSAVVHGDEPLTNEVVRRVLVVAGVAVALIHRQPDARPIEPRISPAGCKSVVISRNVCPPTSFETFRPAAPACRDNASTLRRGAMTGTVPWISREDGAPASPRWMRPCAAAPTCVCPGCCSSSPATSACTTCITSMPRSPTTTCNARMTPTRSSPACRRRPGRTAAARSCCPARTGCCRRDSGYRDCGSPPAPSGR